ncbi:hypothetical protein ACIBCH_38260, partial [Amycolatopsis thailandensis]|uniref:hypothetical protein n=1 Tax=Amycolatopsis thailandensis TaxID=589330 RepID=UPI0037A5728A
MPAIREPNDTKENANKNHVTSRIGRPPCHVDLEPPRGLEPLTFCLQDIQGGFRMMSSSAARYHS